MSELLLFVGLGYVVLGPKRMHAIVHQVARAKRDFNAIRAQLTSQLSPVVNPEQKDPHP